MTSSVAAADIVNAFARTILQLTPEMRGFLSCSLDLSHNRITSLAGLAGLTEVPLERLSLQWNALRSTAGLEALPQLRALDLDYNFVCGMSEAVHLSGAPLPPPSPPRPTSPILASAPSPPPHPPPPPDPPTHYRTGSFWLVDCVKRMLPSLQGVQARTLRMHA